MEEWLIVYTGALLPAVLLFCLFIYFTFVAWLGTHKRYGHFFVLYLYKAQRSKKNFCHNE